MKIIQRADEMQQQSQQWHQSGERIAFVPTMGNLHEGHLSLVDAAKNKADRVVVSIFVNPLQFGPNEDFDDYPRTLERDRKLLDNKRIDVLFNPGVKDIYPRGQQAHTKVIVEGLTDRLCGASRPGHFTGVTTVVNQLFNIVLPHLAVFGEKDFQQLLIIKRMVSDLRMPLTVEGVPTTREDNGLALSSRNQYLTDEEKAQAAQLHQTLLKIEERLKGGELDFSALEKSAKETLLKYGFKPDYFSILRAQDLGTPDETDRHLLIAAAAWLGKPRLIDNLQVIL